MFQNILVKKKSSMKIGQLCYRSFTAIIIAVFFDISTISYHHYSTGRFFYLYNRGLTFLTKKVQKRIPARVSAFNDDFFEKNRKKSCEKGNFNLFLIS